MITDKQLQNMYRLKNVIRYNSRNHIKDESVAEHSFYVALIALRLCEEYKLSEKITHDCLVKAILHDMPEIELNDITHDVKEKLNLRPFLKKYEDEYFIQHFPTYADIMITTDDNVSESILALADALSVKQFCMNERDLGNQSAEIVEIYEQTLTRIARLEQSFLTKYKGESQDE